MADGDPLLEGKSGVGNALLGVNAATSDLADVTGSSSTTTNGYLVWTNALTEGSAVSRTLYESGGLRFQPSSGTLTTGKINTGNGAFEVNSAAERAVEDTMTNGSNLPDGAAIKAYGDANWGGGGGSLTGVYDAAEYGATGTRAAVAAAVAAAASAGGGIVYIPPGTWSFGSTITITSNNINIMGAGVGATNISNTGAFPSFTLGTAPIYNTTVTGITFSGSGSGAVFVFQAFDSNIRNIQVTGGMAYGVRIGISCHRTMVNNIVNPHNTAYVETLVWGDTSSATSANDNATMCCIDNVAGLVSTAGVRFYGKAFGDLVISNVNTYGADGNSRGVSLEGNNSPQYYANHINVSNVHHDGYGSGAVWAYGCDAMNLVGITSGGLCSNFAVITSCTNYVLIGEGTIYGSGAGS